MLGPRDTDVHGFSPYISSQYQYFLHLKVWITTLQFTSQPSRAAEMIQGYRFPVRPPPVPPGATFSAGAAEGFSLPAGRETQPGLWLPSHFPDREETANGGVTPDPNTAARTAPPAPR